MSTAPAATLPDPGSKPGKGAVFAKRLFTTLILWGIILAALFLGEGAVSWGTVWIVLCVLGWAAYREFLNMIDVSGMAFAKNSLHLGGMIYLSLLLFSGHPRFAADLYELPMVCLGGVVVWMMYLLFHHRYQQPRLAPLAKLALGWVYIYFMTGFLVRIFTFDPDHGAWVLLLFIVLTKFSDLGAYVTGSLIGRHKMIPKVSPAKTWEGFAGAIVFSAFCGWLLTWSFPDHFTRFPSSHVILLGAGLGALAVVGDLVESLLKREGGVKDSGQFLPGIGGALDLLDSLLFNAPIMYAYLRLFQSPMAG